VNQHGEWKQLYKNNLTKIMSFILMKNKPNSKYNF